MFNFYVTAVKYKILSIDIVPDVYRDQVKESLGIQDSEQETTTPTETVPDTTEETVNTEEEVAPAE